ncbi:MAG: S9 family peptidase [Proteobacteria bacterium]|nr:S9 family peptidase [Pseudomonadota bacterium]
MPKNRRQPPRAMIRPTEQIYHDHCRPDDYAWLKDPDWQRVMHDPSRLDAGIRAYLEAEIAYTEAETEPTRELRQVLFDEMKGRIKEDDESLPAPDGAYAYYDRHVTDGQYPLFCRSPTGGGAETILLDGNAEAAGSTYFKIGVVGHASDHAHLTFAEDRSGAEIYTLRFRNLETGIDLRDRIQDASGNFVWAEDHRTLFYTVLDPNHRPSRVYRHRLGDDPASDALVFEESDPGFFVGIGKTESRSHIVIDCHDHETSECWLIDAHLPESAPALVAPRVRGERYDVSEHDGRLIILTNSGAAEDFKIVAAPVATPGRDHWRDIVPHQPGRYILTTEVYGDYLARLERVDALPRIVVRRWTDGTEYHVAFDEEAYSLGLEGSYEYRAATLRFSYSSMTTPERIFAYDMATGERELLKETDVPSGHDPADYVTRRMFAPTTDGERIPISILHRAGLDLSAGAPTLLYGYGSYGMSMPAGFQPSRLSLVDRGVVYAIAHVRGGSEKGWRWYKAGKGAKKRNTFEDFIAAAEALIDAGIARRGSIAIHGASAGGMLVGAVLNLRPDLWRAAVADVPFVDVLNTMTDTSLPLTPIEWPEWGNPIESEAAYRHILSYSPYDNVTRQAYPAILATAGLTDPRVTYWESAKWVAKLRALKTDDNPLLLKTNMQAGHAGSAGRFDRLKEIAFNYAFILERIGLVGSTAPQ